MKKFTLYLLLSLNLLTLPISVFAQSHPEVNHTAPACSEQNKYTSQEGKDSDNCKGVSNPKQTDADCNKKGDACDIDWQKKQIAEMNSEINGLSNLQEKKQEVQLTGNCVFDPTKIGSLDQKSNYCTNKQTAITDPKFKQLYEAFLNQKIVSVLEEPISNENIFQRATVCSTKYLKDRNGLLQFTEAQNQSINNINWDNFLEDRQKIVDQYRNLTDAKVSIGVDNCTQHYVESCTPESTYIREVKLGDTLPAIVSCSTVQLLFADSGIDLLKQYVGLIYRWITGIIGVFSVLVIIINGILISTAGGDDGKVSAAKERIIQSLTAMVILFLAGLILYTINPNYFTTSDLQYEINQDEKTPTTP